MFRQLNAQKSVGWLLKAQGKVTLWRGGKGRPASSLMTLFPADRLEFSQGSQLECVLDSTRNRLKVTGVGQLTVTPTRLETTRGLLTTPLGSLPTRGRHFPQELPPLPGGTILRSGTRMGGEPQGVYTTGAGPLLFRFEGLQSTRELRLVIWPVGGTTPEYDQVLRAEALSYSLEASAFPLGRAYRWAAVQSSPDGRTRRSSGWFVVLSPELRKELEQARREAQQTPRQAKKDATPEVLEALICERFGLLTDAIERWDAASKRQPDPIFLQRKQYWLDSLQQMEPKSPPKGEK